jgi:hypothetical protein
VAVLSADVRDRRPGADLDALFLERGVQLVRGGHVGARRDPVGPLRDGDAGAEAREDLR